MSYQRPLFNFRRLFLTASFHVSIGTKVAHKTKRERRSQTKGGKQQTGPGATISRLRSGSFTDHYWTSMRRPPTERTSILAKQTGHELSSNVEKLLENYHQQERHFCSIAAKKHMPLAGFHNTCMFFLTEAAIPADGRDVLRVSNPTDLLSKSSQTERKQTQHKLEHWRNYLDKCKSNPEANNLLRPYKRTIMLTSNQNMRTLKQKIPQGARISVISIVIQQIPP